MERTYYETEFKNRRKGNIHIHEGGKILCIVPPGESRFVESFDPRTTYARWYKLTFKDDDKIAFDENHTWKWPYGDSLCLEALNVDGVETESFSVAGTFWWCYRGIPKLIPVDIHDREWAFIARLEWRLVEHKEKDGDYFKTIKKLEMVKTERSKKEIKNIEKQLLDEAIEKTKREMAQRFPKSVDTMANTNT